MPGSLTLGIDLGAESIGWALVRHGPDKPEIIGASAVIFNNGRDEKGESLAVTRRIHRGMRRRRARYLWRRDRLLRALVRFGLMPQEDGARKALETLDPYRLRAQAAESKIAPHELGRALFHLNQRRGFASNRKTDKKDKDSGAYKKGIETLRETLGDQTLGQYLWQHHQDPQKKADISRKTGIRFRSTRKGYKTEYPFYPSRAMYKAEFDRIHETQKQNQSLTEEQWQNLRDILFNQRPLKPVEPGICSLYYGQEIVNPETGEVTHATKEKRAPHALPSVQMFRIAQDINNLKIRNEERRWRKLTPQERETLWALMNTKEKISFSTIRSKLGLPEDTAINLENDRRDHLKGNKPAWVLAKYFGKDFYKKPLELQDSIVERILDCEHEDELFREAVSNWGLGEDKARKMVYEDEVGEMNFPAGYGQFSANACHALVPLMKNEGLRYDEATARLGVHHSDRRTGGTSESLPYYADIIPLSVSKPKYGNPEEMQKGKIANPTVHIALRQLQKLVNALIARYGKPDRIVLETARELKMSMEDKIALNKEHKANKEANDRIKTDLESIGEWKGDKGRLLLKMKLWEELGKDPNDRRCPYTLQIISRAMLLDGRAEIEHILPCRRTLDDSRANLTVALVSANRMKKNKSPHEAFSLQKPFGWNEKEGEYSYDKILNQAKNFPKNKRWRFEADAMERFEDTEDSWRERFLNDTRYATKIAKQYLETICPRVDASAGKLTFKVREAWGLKKNRDDHRQHAIDALMLTQITLSLVQQTARANANEALDNFTIPTPEEIGWPTLREDALKAIHAAIIYHRPDHGLGGEMLKAGAYGRPIKGHPIEKNYDLVSRMDFHETELKHIGLGKDARSEKILVRDRNIRRALLEKAIVNLPEEESERDKTIAALLDLTEDRKQWKTVSEAEFKKIVHEYSVSRNIRRVRILQKASNFRNIKHMQKKQPNAKTDLRHKALVLGENHHVAWWLKPDGEIVPQFVSLLAANGKNVEKPHPAAKRLLKLHKNDLIKAVHGGEEKILRVIGLNPSQGQPIKCIEHFEAGELSKRMLPGGDLKPVLFKTEDLVPAQIRKIHVDPTGKVYDPGPFCLPEKATSIRKTKTA